MATARRLYTVDEYLALERASPDVKHEYHAGEIVAMAGASPEHAAIALNIGAALYPQLRGQPCRAFSSDLRVKIEATSRYFYPDVTVVCGEPAFENTRPQTLLNPTLVIEVLSESTEAYDRGDKFLHYQRVPSLIEYVLVAPNRPRVERFARHGEDWLYTVAEGRDAALSLLTIGGTLSLAEVYDKVVFPPDEGDGARDARG